MPYDSEVSRLQGEISQLEKEIAAINTASSYVYAYSPTNADNTIQALAGIITRLSRDLEYKEMKLSAHRQRTKESGVKF